MAAKRRATQKRQQQFLAKAISQVLLDSCDTTAQKSNKAGIGIF